MARGGVTFQVVPAEAAGRTTRMDVAAFVGLAMSGPLHTPVPIEDPVQFDQIFGGSYTLSLDRRTGLPETAHLRAAVHAFFAGGGSRCWVVRVAGPRAVANQFVVPGLMRVPGGTGSPRSVLLQARSVGAWSDSLRVGTSLRRMPLESSRVERSGSRVSLDLSPWLVERVAAGDLVRVTLPDAKLLLYVAVDEVRSAQVWGRPFWFRLPDGLPLTPQRVRVRCQDPLRPGAEPVPTDGYWAPASPVEGVLYLRLAEAPHPGAVAAVTFAAGAELILTVAGVRPATREERSQWTGQYDDLVAATLKSPLAPAREADLPVETVLGAAERLNFHLWIQDVDGRLTTAKDLGFTGRHPHFAGYLPDDLTLLQTAQGRGSLRDGEFPGQALWPFVTTPRFPLAASDQQFYGQLDEVWLPLAMGVAGPELYAGAVPRDLSPLERDGLGDFSPALLADPKLIHLPADLLESGLLARITDGQEPLLGLHALWQVDEVTLVALPDAGHAGWAPRAPVALPAAPELVGAYDGDGNWQLLWSCAGDDLRYRVQWSPDAQFAAEVGEALQTQTEHTARPPAGQPKEFFFRVRAERHGEPGPWSATVTAMLPRSAFAPVRAQVVPGLRLEPDGGGLYRAAWPRAGADQYELQMCHTPEFDQPLTVYRGERPGESVWHSGSGTAYYRLRARWGDYWGPWSATVAVPGTDRTARWQAVDPGGGPGTGAGSHRAELLALHMALLRMAAARGDLFGLLSLPHTYRDSDVSAYSRQLAAELRRQGEEKALSFGALYHPWVWVRQGRERLLCPPDGPMAGQYAAGARSRGVWFPAANQPLAGVAEVFDPVEPETQLLLERERVNVMERLGSGVTVMSAATLSREPDLRAVTNRRLLSQLRRILLHEGTYLVFEPNNDALYQAAVTRCRRILSDLFLQGAFAGATPEESFAVAAAAGTGGREATDAGLFALEVAIAPSRPLSFLKVRLLQSQGGGLTVREG